MAAWWVLPAVMAGQAGLKYLTSRSRTPAFEKTATGKRLSEISETGAISRAEQGGVIGQVASRASNVAQGRRAGIRGYLESRGMGSSVAGARALDAPGRDVQRSVAETTRGLGVANERTKNIAALGLAQGRDRSADIRRSERRQRTSDLIGGLTGALTAGITGTPQFNVPENLSEMSLAELFEWARSSNIDFEDAQKLWEEAVFSSLEGN